MIWRSPVTPAAQKFSECAFAIIARERFRIEVHGPAAVCSSSRSHGFQSARRGLRNRPSCWMKRRGRKCRRWPSPTTAICLPLQISSTKPASATSSPSSDAKFTSPEAAATTAVKKRMAATEPGSRRRRTGGPRQQSPGAALRIARGLPQSNQAGFRRISRGLLLQAAHRLRPARETQ